MNDVFLSEWFGVLGAGVIAAVITAVAMRAYRGCSLGASGRRLKCSSLVAPPLS